MLDRIKWCKKVAEKQGRPGAWIDDRRLTFGDKSLIDSYERQLGGQLSSAIKHIYEQPGQVLDIGCGSSRAAKQLQQTVPETSVFGTNLVPDRRHAQYLGVDRVAISNTLDLTEHFGSNSMRVIFAVRSISYIDDSNRPAVCVALSEVLSPGGRIWLAGIAHEAQYGLETSIAPFADELKKHGFVVENFDMGTRKSSPSSWLCARKGK